MGFIAKQWKWALPERHFGGQLLPPSLALRSMEISQIVAQLHEELRLIARRHIASGVRCTLATVRDAVANMQSGRLRVQRLGIFDVRSIDSTDDGDGGKARRVVFRPLRGAPPEAAQAATPRPADAPAEPIRKPPAQLELRTLISLIQAQQPEVAREHLTKIVGATLDVLKRMIADSDGGTVNIPRLGRFSSLPPPKAGPVGARPEVRMLYRPASPAGLDGLPSVPLTFLDSLSAATSPDVN